MPPSLLIYGATGFTGRLIAQEAVTRGLRPVLCGRSPGRLKGAAAALGGLAHRVASLEPGGGLEAIIDPGDVVLNAAGPFSHTAATIADTCVALGAHYLDVTGEVEVYEQLAARDEAARRAGVMLLPGVGFDVVASDCLAAHVANTAQGATWLALAIRGLTFVSRGSYRTLVEQAGRPVRVRRGGELVETRAGALRRSFDFGDGPRDGVAVSWGDVTTAWHTTGIPDIDVYFEATPAVRAAHAANRLLGGALRSPASRVLLDAWAEILPAGPTPDQRSRHGCVLVAEAGDSRCVLARARLHTPEAYAFTGAAAAAVAETVLDGACKPGFRTPAGLLGASWVTGLEGVRLEAPGATPRDGCGASGGGA
jgi:short subunit dehydrogenase-like uncharacterized protein